MVLIPEMQGTRSTTPHCRLPPGRGHSPLRGQGVLAFALSATLTLSLLGSLGAQVYSGYLSNCHA